ncbi:Importin beta-like SAD2 [Dirofilaria immitis]
MDENYLMEIDIFEFESIMKQTRENYINYYSIPYRSTGWKTTSECNQNIMEAEYGSKWPEIIRWTTAAHIFLAPNFITMIKKYLFAKK